MKPWLRLQPSHDSRNLQIWRRYNMVKLSLPRLFASETSKTKTCETTRPSKESKPRYVIAFEDVTLPTRKQTLTTWGLKQNSYRLFNVVQPNKIRRQQTRTGCGPNDGRNRSQRHWFWLLISKKPLDKASQPLLITCKNDDRQKARSLRKQIADPYLFLNSASFYQALLRHLPWHKSQNHFLSADTNTSVFKLCNTEG